MQRHTLDKALEAISDVILIKHLDEIEDSRILTSGVIGFQFLFGDQALRYLYTHHTYCFMEAVYDFGMIYQRCYNVEYHNGSAYYNIELSMLATLLLRLMQEQADEYECLQKDSSVFLMVRDVLNALDVSDEHKAALRREVRYQRKLGVREDRYHNPPRQLLLRSPNPKINVSAKIIPFKVA